MRVYLDNCVFNRPFDDQSQLLISLQTQAKLAIGRFGVASDSGSRGVPFLPGGGKAWRLTWS